MSLGLVLQICRPQLCRPQKPCGLDKIILTGCGSGTLSTGRMVARKRISASTGPTTFQFGPQPCFDVRSQILLQYLCYVGDHLATKAIPADLKQIAHVGNKTLRWRTNRSSLML